MAPYRLSRTRTFAAWLLTGPLGHGAAATIDIVAFAGTLARQRAAARIKGE